LITIKLLGRAKKVAGQSYVILDRPFASISEILKFLEDNALKSKALDRNNILITVNDADSTMLGRDDAIVKTGDIVTIVSAVHGG
jgi:molybdopterin converting factor small subunit